MILLVPKPVSNIKRLRKIRIFFFLKKITKFFPLHFKQMNIMSLNNELHTDNNYYRHPHHQQQQQQQNQEDTKLNPFTNRKNYFDYNNLQNNNRTNYFPAPSPSSSTTTTTMMNDANITGSGSSTVAEIIPKSLNVRKKHSPSPSQSSSSSTSKLSPKNGKSGQLNKSQLPSQKTNRPISSTDSTVCFFNHKNRSIFILFFFCFLVSNFFA